MGKVIPTLTNTTYITIILPQNCPKTTSKLPQNFWICSDTFGTHADTRRQMCSTGSITPKNKGRGGHSGPKQGFTPKNFIP